MSDEASEVTAEAVEPLAARVDHLFRTIKPRGGREYS